MPQVRTEPMNEVLTGTMRITYATTYDPDDVHAWSGTVYHVARALEASGIAVDYLGELARNRVFVNKALNRIYRMSALSDGLPAERTVRMATMFAERIREHLLESRSDVVFSPGSIPIALLKTKRPKVFYTDATFAGILADYPAFRSYPKRYIEEGHQLEQAALTNCDLAIYSSRWAARTALENYDVDEHKIRVVPFGANFETNPLRAEVLAHADNRDDAMCELLFAAVHWEHKGGPKVMEVARLLRQRGIPVRLHVLGCDPEQDEVPRWVVQHGFISKATEEGRRKIAGIFSASHFLLLPTVAECLGLVLCEANAFAVPCMANDVGGISEVVKQDVNGHLFHPDAPASEWADRIAEIFLDKVVYSAMAHRSRAQFDERLNWGSAGSAIKGHLLELLD